MKHCKFGRLELCYSDPCKYHEKCRVTSTYKTTVGQHEITSTNTINIVMESTAGHYARLVGIENQLDGVITKS